MLLSQAIVSCFAAWGKKSLSELMNWPRFTAESPSGGGAERKMFKRAL